MSEVLRAILDFNCVDSRPAFYSSQVAVDAPATGLALGRRIATIQCKIDTYFLAMGAVQDCCYVNAAGPYLWEAKAFPSTWQIRRASTGERFSQTPQLQVLQTYNLNNFVTWDEYILFSPGELISIHEDVRTGTIAIPVTAYSFVTLMGVEFQMPAGKG